MRLEDLARSVNIAEDLEHDRISAIVQECMRGYEADEASRADWMKRADDAMKSAMQHSQQKDFPWRNASNVKFPLLTTAAIQFAARAYPAIIPSRNIVKGVVRGSDEGEPLVVNGQQAVNEQGQPQWKKEPGAKRERANRISRHMSYQLLDEMPEWEEDTDRLLHLLPIVGCAFRKTWFDPVWRRNRSVLVRAEDLVVSYNAQSMDTAPRATHVIQMDPVAIMENQRAGVYCDCDLGVNPNGEDDALAPRKVLEQHTLIDLDDDGMPEPYVVTIDEASQEVLRIVARYRMGSIVRNGTKVVKIPADRFFTKYDFLPNPDGGFYGIGFGHLLHPLSEAIDAAINQMIDAGTLQNTGGGFIGVGLRIKSGKMDFRLGEWKKVEATGTGIRDNVVPMQWPGPSPVLFNLLGFLVDAARDITSVKDIMTGDSGPANEAASRTMARIEQGMKVFSAIYKRVFRSLKDEYQKIYLLNSLYLSPETYFTLLDEPEAVAKEDYDPDDLDVSPAADPNMISDMLKVARGEFLMQFAGDPYLDPIKTRRQILDSVNIEDADELLIEQPPTNPEVAKAADEMELEKRRLEMEATVQAAKVENEAKKTAAEIEELQSRTALNYARAAAEGRGQDIDAAKVASDAALKAAKIDSDRENQQRSVRALA